MISTKNSGESQRYYPTTENGQYFLSDGTIVPTVDSENSPINGIDLGVWFHSAEEAMILEEQFIEKKEAVLEEQFIEKKEAVLEEPVAETVKEKK